MATRVLECIWFLHLWFSCWHFVIQPMQFNSIRYFNTKFLFQSISSTYVSSGDKKETQSLHKTHTPLKHIPLYWHCLLIAKILLQLVNECLAYQMKCMTFWLVCEFECERYEFHFKIAMNSFAQANQLIFQCLHFVTHFCFCSAVFLFSFRSLASNIQYETRESIEAQ